MNKFASFGVYTRAYTIFKRQEVLPVNSSPNIYHFKVKQRSGDNVWCDVYCKSGQWSCSAVYGEWGCVFNGVKGIICSHIKACQIWLRKNNASLD